MIFPLAQTFKHLLKPSAYASRFALKKQLILKTLKALGYYDRTKPFPYLGNNQDGLCMALCFS